ncbi:MULTISPECIES: hypothetical protein [unclassified Arcicella]|uniref:hypothetical protein n=1 Tax=unclassified Arcicella TaxID=2644986 RepID=UPI00285BD996|nr:MULTISPECIES: hypothetical protein [unclassified Arcicella]MDR6560700.1 hypothetical protein [Arcicella sp. BE51]MDR6810584.1 hypothetical protein [Arcicella sp. BE140]MDR6821934.1 hypothetical protein [Arcicella sp. BE139]
MPEKVEISQVTVIYTRPSDQHLLLLGGLGTFLYVIFFLIRTEYISSVLCLFTSIVLTYRYLEKIKSKAKIIISQDGIQVVGQPFVSWAFVHGLQIRPEVKGNSYSEILVFTNNGRIQEIPINTLAITAWQLEELLNIYQERFRESIVEDEELN